MSDLFNIPETLSPRLAWMKRYDVQVYRVPGIAVEEKPWTAFVGNVQKAFETKGCTTGTTEDEAITNLAKLLNIPLWNEEGFTKL